LIFSPTGAITNMVRKSARPIRTWVGGTCWVPMAVRRKLRVMVIRMKAVHIARM
jgi:hypothetical protein